MKLRQKILLLAITPLIVALLAIALAVRYQAGLLAQQQHSTIESAYLATKEAELKHYVALAQRAIAHLYDSGRNDPKTLEEAKALLATLDYGSDGYFYLYDMNGNSLVHPRRPELVGTNLWDLRDEEGNLTIQRLIAQAKNGGGLVRYTWEKPSVGKTAPKLGYVVALDRWGWMLGTGLYMDDVDNALAAVDAQISGNILNTMLWIAGIAIASALAVALSGVALNISESRIADAKLRELAQRVVKSQEDERARLSRDLHDGISQWLVSIKLQVESGIAKLADGRPEHARTAFDRATGQLNDVLSEVRRISHDLRPALLDDLGLAPALEHLSTEFGESTGIRTSFEVLGNCDELNDMNNTALFRVAQEALTNIERHANASGVTLRLQEFNGEISLAISDDGIGFDVAEVSKHPTRGIGLRNMHERVSAIGGKLEFDSTTGGTTVTAILPKV